MEVLPIIVLRNRRDVGLQLRVLTRLVELSNCFLTNACNATVDSSEKRLSVATLHKVFPQCVISMMHFAVIRHAGGVAHPHASVAEYAERVRGGCVVNEATVPIDDCFAFAERIRVENAYE